MVENLNGKKKESKTVGQVMLSQVTRNNCYLINFSCVYDLIDIFIKMYENKRERLQFYNQTLYKNEQQKLSKH